MNRKPLLIDLFAGLGGWSRAFIDEGWRTIGFDIERHDYGTGGYPGQLVLQDVCALEERQLADADMIVASSPCQEFSYRAMPWKRAKALGPPVLGIKLFWQAFRLQREIELATGKRVPLVAENVRGAEPWVGRAQWKFGSYYLWGDLPALMPRATSVKVPGFRFDGSGRSFQTASVKVASLDGGRRTDPGKGARFTSRDCGIEALYADRDSEGIKQYGSGPEWWRTGNGAMPSKSPRRKAASAMIALIPYPLAQHLARVFKPDWLASNAEALEDMKQLAGAD